jgi:hypothetical protein
MKTIMISVAAGSLLAALTLAQAPQGYRRWTVPSTGARPAPGESRAPKPDLVYVITGAFQFGAVNLRSGTFLPIGPGLPPDVGGGLVPGRGKTLLSLAFSGNLEAIDPVTGITSVAGATGLHDCTLPTDPYDPKCANVIGRLDENIYVTDFVNNLYSVNSATGAARLIGPTGIPPLTFVPFTANPDGSVNVYGESLFSADGKLYAYFSANAINFQTGADRILVPGAIYRINPETGHTTFVAPTNSNLTAIVNVEDTLYGFDAAAGQVVALNLRNGETTLISALDPAANIIGGATPAHPSPDADH